MAIDQDEARGRLSTRGAHCDELRGRVSEQEPRPDDEGAGESAAVRDALDHAMQLVEARPLNS